MRNKIFHAILFIGFFSLMGCLSLTAFNSYEEEWKKKNDRGNRYEGTKRMKVGAPAIQLIAFYSSREEYKPDDTLKVRFYLQQPSNVYLTGQELTIKHYYWMEAKPKQWRQGWNEFAPWPVMPFLGRYEISPDNLGVLVRPGNSFGSGSISPVILYRSSPPPKIVEYTAYFRPGKSITRGTFKIYRNGNQRTSIKDGIIGSQSAGQPFMIKFTLGPDWQGMVKLRVDVFLRNGLKPHPSREYTFYHIPFSKQ